MHFSWLSFRCTFIFFFFFFSAFLFTCTRWHRNACMSIPSGWVGEKKYLGDTDGGGKKMVPSPEEALGVLLFCELSFRTRKKGCH